MTESTDFLMQIVLTRYAVIRDDDSVMFVTYDFDAAQARRDGLCLEFPDRSFQLYEAYDSWYKK